MAGATTPDTIMLAPARPVRWRPTGFAMIGSGRAAHLGHRARHQREARAALLLTPVNSAKRGRNRLNLACSGQIAGVMHVRRGEEWERGGKRREEAGTGREWGLTQELCQDSWLKRGDCRTGPRLHLARQQDLLSSPHPGPSTAAGATGRARDGCHRHHGPTNSTEMLPRDCRKGHGVPGIVHNLRRIRSRCSGFIVRRRGSTLAE